MKQVRHETGSICSQDGTHIAYSVQGQGPLLLLVHGALSDRMSAHRLVELLASQYTVITYDRRGRGESQDALTYSVQKEIYDLQILVQTVGYPEYVYGMSSGALLVLTAAQHIPFSLLALYEPPGHMPKKQLRQMNEKLHRFLLEDKRDEAVETFFSEAVGMPSEVVKGLKRGRIWSKLLATAHTLPYDIALAEQFCLETIRHVKTPSIVMGGTLSPQPVQQCVTDIAHALPHAQAKLLSGQGHNVDATAIHPYLVEFFSNAE